MSDPKLVDRIELRPIEQLIPYIRNPRTHSPAQIAQIAASIREFGFTNPILVDGQGNVIAGHGRLLAARQLGLRQVPVALLEHLTPAPRRAYVIADNQIALNAGWDEELLAIELHDLQLDGFDLSLIGFSDEEVKRFLSADGEAESGHTDKDAAPVPPQRPVTLPGDLWLLGSHRLFCGDATQPESLEVVLDGELVDMVFTDPPYNVGYAGSPRERQERAPMLNDNLGGSFDGFLRQACTNMLEVTKGALYVCMSSAELHTLHRAFVAAGGHWSTFVIWAKNHWTLGRADYQRQYEPILYGWRAGAEHYWCGARDQGDIWFVDKPAANDLHPTMKPVALIERAIRNSSKSRDIVFDPFAGSGSTLIACHATGRTARLIELDPAYADVICRRWQEHVGTPAMLAMTGQTFSQVAGARHGGTA